MSNAYSDVIAEVLLGALMEAICMEHLSLWYSLGSFVKYRKSNLQVVKRRYNYSSSFYFSKHNSVLLK